MCNGLWLDKSMSNTTYHIADAPKFAGMVSYDCSACGHPELGRPVFLDNGSGVIAVGSGCAAKILGIGANEVEAHLAEVAVAEFNFTQLDAFRWVGMFMPGRVTARLVADTADRYRSLTADEVATVLDAYKAIARFGATRVRAAAAAVAA
jgi:pimeloyl-ACP methyl ester carboxylesterase